MAKATEEVFGWNHSMVVDVLLEFFEIAIHHILFEREAYPKASFTRRKMYGTPVQMSRIPSVHEYIYEVVSNMREPLRQNLLEKVVLVILNEENVPIERFVFEVDLGPEEDFGKVKGKTYTLQDLEKDFQAFLLKINVVESFQPHTRGPKCSWNVMVVTREIIDGGDKWVRSDWPAQRTPAIIPLKSLTLEDIKFQLYVEDLTHAFVG